MTFVDGTVDDEPEGEVTVDELINNWASVVAEVKCTGSTGMRTADASTKVDWACFLLLRSSPVLEGTVDASIDGSKDDEREGEVTVDESTNNWASVVAEAKCTGGTGTGSGTGKVTVDAGEVKSAVDAAKDDKPSRQEGVLHRQLNACEILSR